MRKIGSVLLAGAMVSALLAGCSGGNQKPAAESTTAAAKTESSAGTTDAGAAQTSDMSDFSGVKLVYWSNWEATEPQGVVLKEAVEAFNKETGAEVTLEFKGRKGIKEGLIPALDANQQIDIVDGQNNKSNLGDRAISLEDLVKKYDYEKRSNPALMKLCRSYTDGVLKEIPYQYKANAYLYNKALFKQAGIEKVPENWQEFQDVCQKLQDAGITPLTTDDAYAPQAFGMHLARLIGSDGVTDVVKNNGWNKPEVLQAAKAFEDLAKKGYFSKQVGSNTWPTGQNTEFAIGKVAMYCVGTYVPNEVKGITGDNFDWGFFNYPEVDDGINGLEAMVVGSQSISITSKCANPDAAFKLIEKITRGEYDAKLADASLGLPTDTDNTSWPKQLADVKPYFEKCTEIFATSGGAENNPEITPALKENLMNLYAGKITAEQFVSNMETAAK